MRTIAITGGKGGTGKSTVATVLARELSADYSVLLVDADVDCPNDHLLLKVERVLERRVEQRIPHFDMVKCVKCGRCASVCKNKAIVSLPMKTPLFVENQCNGCGACKIVCPAGAIDWSSKVIGRVFSGRKGDLSFLSGELEPNQPISEFIVNQLNEQINKVKEEYDFIIVDTAAGSHCPVVAALEYADDVFAVTEPTPLGAHDLEVILRLLIGMNKTGKIIINRSDLGDSELIESLSRKYSSDVILKIPFSMDIARAYAKGSPISIKDIGRLIGV